MVCCGAIDKILLVKFSKLYGKFIVKAVIYHILDMRYTSEYQFTDLFKEGLSGILAEQNGGVVVFIIII